MMRFREQLTRFMMGRYGSDRLNFGLLILYLVIMVANLFLRFLVLNILELLIVVLVVYRMLSRDIPRRRAENAKFEAVWFKVSRFFQRYWRRVSEIRTHRYRKCPHCKVVMRLPRKVGKHTVVCPRCKTRVAVRVWF